MTVNTGKLVRNVVTWTWMQQKYKEVEEGVTGTTCRSINYCGVQNTWGRTIKTTVVKHPIRNARQCPSIPTGHHSGLHTSSTTPLCCHRPSRPSSQPCNCLSLVPTAVLLHPRSPVVERSPHPHKNCSLPAHLPPQLEDSPLHSVPRLLFGSFLIYCPFPITVLSPCILFSTYKLYLSWYGSLTCMVW